MLCSFAEKRTFIDLDLFSYKVWFRKQSWGQSNTIFNLNSILGVFIFSLGL